MRGLKQILAVFLCTAMVLVFIPATEANNSKQVSIPKGAGEFNGHYYYMSDDGMTWDEAARLCEAMGGHLATITSAEEQAFIETLIKSGTQIFYWLGGTDEAKEDNWVWITGETWSYDNWNSGKPDNSSGIDGANENYLAIYTQRMVNQWNDLQNAGDVSGTDVAENAGFICEWDSAEEETLGEIGVEKYDDENGGYTDEYDYLCVGDQVRFSIEVTVDKNTSMSFKKTNWSCEPDEKYEDEDIKAVSFGLFTTSERNSPEDDGEKVYYLSITATLGAEGNHTVIFTSASGDSKSTQISVRNSTCELGEIEVAKYDDASGNYTSEYDNIYIGDSLTFSIEVTTDEGAEMSFDKTNWSCIADEEYDDGKTDALSFGHLSVLGPYKSDEKGKSVYYISISAEPNLLGTHEIIFAADDNQTQSADFTVDIKVVFNDEILKFDQAPVMINDRVMVPMRAIFEEFGAVVDWDNATKTVTSTLGSTSITLTIDSYALNKNGAVTYFDVPAQLYNGHTMVPIRAVAEAFGAAVTWDGDTCSVYIDSSAKINALLINADNDLTGYDTGLFRKILLSNTLAEVNEQNIHVFTEPTSEQFEILINQLILQAGENDITYFFYSGHGGKSGMDRAFYPAEEDAFICPYYSHTSGHDSSYNITMKSLAEDYLSRIPGKIVVILQSCYSGAMTENGFIDNDKFKVITSCGSTETSELENIGLITKGQFTIGKFMEAFLKGLGALESNNPIEKYIFKYNGKVQADDNGDRKVTLSELYKFIDENMDKEYKDDKGNKCEQNPTVSDKNDETVIFSY